MRLTKNDEMVGKKFGRLLVLELMPHDGTKSRKCRCLCDCGNEKIAPTTDVRRLHTRSCGCLERESKRNACMVHGQSNTRLFRIWCDMRRRCRDASRKSWGRYGNRGIKVCDEWKRFESFYEWAISNGYKENLTIERMDNDGDYCPENCRWATYKEQANNTSRNHLITYRGETHNLTQWSEITGISQRKLIDRFGKLGWDTERALEGWTPHESGRR